MKRYSALLATSEQVRSERRICYPHKYKRESIYRGTQLLVWPVTIGSSRQLKETTASIERGKEDWHLGLNSWIWNAHRKRLSGKLVGRVLYRCVASTYALVLCAH